MPAVVHASAREPKMAAVPRDSSRRFRVPLPQGNLPAACAFASYASGPVRLAPRGWLRRGMARDCRGRRHGPVRAVRPRLDPGAGHRGAVEETGGLSAARCSCGAALSCARVLCWIDTKLAQLSVARIELPLAELFDRPLELAVPLASRGTGHSSSRIAARISFSSSRTSSLSPGPFSSMRAIRS
jgi:hypothetical protein